MSKQLPLPLDEDDTKRQQATQIDVAKLRLLQRRKVRDKDDLWIRELIRSIVQLMRSGPPAPRNPPFKPNGIRDRALRQSARVTSAMSSEF